MTKQPAKKRKTKGTPDSVDIHVGQRLKVRRSLLGLSQEKLAEAIGVTFQQIQKYEQGMNRISAGRLYQIAKVLQVPIVYFFENISTSADTIKALGLSDNKQESFLSEDLMQNKETIELVSIYYSIKDPKMRKDIIKFIKSMAQHTS